MSTSAYRSRTCILKCPNPTHIYRFPLDQIGKKVWLKQLNLEDCTKSSGVCDRHFSDRMRTQGKCNITQWAIPDINLPKPKSHNPVEEFFDDDGNFYYDFDEDSAEVSQPVSNGHPAKTVQTSSSAVQVNRQVKNVAGSSNRLDFEDMIDSENNNKSHKDTSTPDYSGLEEAIEIEDDAQELATEKRNGDVTDEDTISASANVEINSTFKRKLIACVRRRRILYDPAHPSFGNVEKKTRAWERIGQIQKLNGLACRELWLNMRFKYQTHVRNLRLWLAGETKQRERPRIQFENDLIFLWRFISDKNDSDDIAEVFPPPFIETSQSLLQAHDDQNLIIDEPLDKDEFEKSDNFVGHLIDLIQTYPEMYDTNHPHYGQPKRRSIIWEAIANEVKQRTTKCLFSWFQIQMRYELELTNKKNSYLVAKMKFLEKHILANEKSPYKRTTLVKTTWVDPIYKCEDQHLLIAAMITSKRTRPYFANIDCPFASLYLLKVTHWETVAKYRNISREKCEVTWIIVQMMYCELAEYRRNNCCLRDEWELESVITKLRETITKGTWKDNSNAIPMPAQTPVQPPQPPPAPIVQHSNSANNAMCGFGDCGDIEMIHDDDTQPPAPALTPLPPIESAPEPEPLPAALPAPLTAHLPALQPAPLRAPVPAPTPVFEKPAQPQVEAPKNEVVFKIPSTSPETQDKIVVYKLDVPISELSETTVVDVDSVLPNAHIVIAKSSKGDPKVHLFTFERRQELIGEVMARPIIFNEPCKTSKVSRLFMGEISSDMGLPVEVCLAFWDYIVEKQFFIGYNPSWKKTSDPKWIPAPYPIFDKFIKFAESKGWNEFISVLADFMQEIGNFPLIYSDLKVNSSWNRRQCYMRDIAEVWAILARKFVVLENHKLIWDKFKQIFLLYMSEIELSMYNPWPTFWAPVFSKMKFLLDFKYNPKDPIYHLLSIKIDEEIELCRQNSTEPLFDKLDAVTNAKSIFQLLKENEYLEDFTWVNRARFISKMKSFPMLYDINNPQFGNKEAKLDAWQEMALLFHCTVGECHLIFQHLMKSFLIFRARDPSQICRVNAKYWENMTYIYSCAVPNSIDPKTITGRSFRLTSNGSTIKLAEEFQAEISLVDAKPRLILKNFASAINSLPIQLQESATQHLKYILTEYTRGQNEEIIVDV